MKKLIVLLLILAVGGVGAQRAYDWYSWQVGTPVAAGSSEPVVVKITLGESSDEIGADLARKNLIRDPRAFLLYLRVSGKRSLLEAGDYVIKRSMSMEQIVEALQHSQSQQVAVTIPEGYTAKQEADLVEKAGIGSAADYLAASKADWPQDFLSSRPKGSDLEGYLFPDTYSLDKGSSVKDLVKRQLDQLGTVLTPDVRAQLAQPAAGRPVETVSSVVILASMVERESNVNSDRAKVCSVYYNRLANEQPLQVDATILYAMGVWKKQLTLEDLKINSPYNTYLHSGLPPGPISNPGAAALRACIKPEKTDYFYYFADKKGDTHFDKTLDEFERDKQRYGVSGYP